MTDERASNTVFYATSVNQSEFAGRVKELRVRLLGKQAVLAEAIGMTEGAVSRWESGARLRQEARMRGLTVVFEWRRGLSSDRGDVSLGGATVKRWVWRYREQGTVAPTPKGGGTPSTITAADIETILQRLGALKTELGNPQALDIVTDKGVNNKFRLVKRVFD